MTQRVRTAFVFSNEGESPEGIEKKLQEKLDEIQSQQNPDMYWSPPISIPFFMSQPSRIGVLIQWTEQHKE